MRSKSKPKGLKRGYRVCFSFLKDPIKITYCTCSFLSAPPPPRHTHIFKDDNWPVSSWELCPIFVIKYKIQCDNFSIFFSMTKVLSCIIGLLAVLFMSSLTTWVKTWWACYSSSSAHTLLLASTLSSLLFCSNHKKYMIFRAILETIVLSLHLIFRSV